jgi:hypothetical protein
MSYGFTPTMQSLISICYEDVRCEEFQQPFMRCLLFCMKHTDQRQKNPKAETRTSKLGTCAQHNHKVLSRILAIKFSTEALIESSTNMRCREANVLRSSFESSHTAHITNVAAARTWYINNHGHSLYLLLDYQGHSSILNKAPSCSSNSDSSNSDSHSDL